MSTVVQFVGGELDGQQRAIQNLTSVYCCLWRPRPPQQWGNPSLFTELPLPQVTTYLLTLKDGLPLYVERELMYLAEQEGIDPRDA